MDIDFSLPKTILPFLKDRVDDYYLVGGTALSMFYYEHRESFDLDFFTQRFSKERILNIVEILQKDSGWAVELTAEQEKKDFVRVAVFMVHLDQRKKCKLDFVEDYTDLMNPLKHVDGIDVLSLEDIYLRKIHAIAGHMSACNDLGQRTLSGGRQEAKDFYDLYCLSTITMPLSQFVSRYCRHVIQEGVVRWYRTYDRMLMKTGLLDLVTRTEPDYRLIENHFKKEIDKLLENMIGG